MHSGIPRDQIFVTTKLSDRDQGYESALEACELSLEKLGLDYVGMYIMGTGSRISAPLYCLQYACKLK